MATSITVVARARGFAFVLDGQVGLSDTIPTLTGTTVQLTVRHPDGATRAVYTAAVASDGKTAAYSTTDGSEIPAPGRYTAQFVVTSSGGEYPTQPFEIIVLERI